MKHVQPKWKSMVKDILQKSNRKIKDHSFIYSLIVSIIQTLLTGLVSMSHNAMCIFGKRHYIVLQYFHKKLSQLGANFQFFDQLMSGSSDVSQFKKP